MIRNDNADVDKYLRREALLRDLFASRKIPSGLIHEFALKEKTEYRRLDGGKFRRSAVLNMVIRTRNILEYTRARRVSLANQIGATGEKICKNCAATRTVATIETMVTVVL